MVRLVFRPYTQIRRSICTSESLRASTRVSSGFALLRHSSPSFGSQHACSTSEPSQKVWSGRRCPPRQRSQPFTFIARPGFPPKHSQACWTPWSVFQDGSLKAITPSILSNVCVGETPSPFPAKEGETCCGPRSRPSHATQGYNTPEGATFPRPFSDGQNRCWPVTARKYTAPRQGHG